MAERQCRELSAPRREENIGSDNERTRPQLDQACESRIDLRFRAGVEDVELQSENAGRRLQGARQRFGGGTDRVGAATTVVVGTNSCSISNCFCPSSAPIPVTPVMLPPGRFMLATSPAATGSLAVTKTIGMVVVAAFAASAAGVVIATITFARRSTSSAAIAGSRA